METARDIFSRQLKDARPLEIRVENPCVILYGTPAEAENVEIRGRVVLKNLYAMSIRSVKVTLEGTRKVSWLTDAITPSHVFQKRRHVHCEQALFPTEGCKARVQFDSSASLEWEFKFVFQGSWPESVEGQFQSYIVYRLYAVVDRGRLRKDIHAWKDVRVIRTLRSSEIDALSNEQVVQNVSEENFRCKVRVPRIHHIFGTPVSADFDIIPLREGLFVRSAVMEVLETRFQWTFREGQPHLSNKSETAVARREMQIPESAQMIPWDSDMGHIDEEPYQFRMTLGLPRSFRECRQATVTPWIAICHWLQLKVNVEDAQGQQLSLPFRMQLYLFISPNYPIDEDQTILTDHYELGTTAGSGQSAPARLPDYGEHHYDRTYNDDGDFIRRASEPGITHRIDPLTGSTTVIGPTSSLEDNDQSLVGVPDRALFGHSLPRSESSGDMTGGRSLSQTRGGQTNGTLRPALNLQRRATTGRLGPDMLVHNQINLDSSSQPVSSHFDLPDRLHTQLGLAELQNEDYSDGFDMNALSRTPSYDTAIQTMPKKICEALPLYDSAISGPSGS